MESGRAISGVEVCTWGSESRKGVQMCTEPAEQIGRQRLESDGWVVEVQVVKVQRMEIGMQKVEAERQ